MEKQETSLDLAYKIAVDYFSSSIERFDAQDGKIQTLFTFAIGVFAVAPVLMKPNTAAVPTLTFWVGMGLLISAGIVSILARLYGKLNILNPQIIYEKTLNLKPEDFKKSVISTASTAYEHNSKVIENKHLMNIGSMILFGCALVVLIYWLVNHGI